MTDPEKQCAGCPHLIDQHDEEGFCEVEITGSGFCDCPGFVPEAAMQEGAD